MNLLFFVHIFCWCYTCLTFNIYPFHSVLREGHRVLLTGQNFILSLKLNIERNYWSIATTTHRKKRQLKRVIDPLVFRSFKQASVTKTGEQANSHEVRQNEQIVQINPLRRVCKNHHELLCILRPHLLLYLVQQSHTNRLCW